MLLLERIKNRYERLFSSFFVKVSIIGNILNGLKSNEINSIEKSKLQLNNFYRKKAMESMNSTESTGNTNGTQQQQ